MIVLRPGDRAPDAPVRIDGEETSLALYRGEGQLVLTFLRHLQ